MAFSVRHQGNEQKTKVFDRKVLTAQERKCKCRNSEITPRRCTNISALKATGCWNSQNRHIRKEMTYKQEIVRRWKRKVCSINFVSVVATVRYIGGVAIRLQGCALSVQHSCYVSYNSFTNRRRYYYRLCNLYAICM